ncbi:MAG: lytic transglycosylase domain-containing protein [Sulfurospirillaceae bacterium]|nr:lytic transglycosylase domain-containing protein [Sulfurospirillaceae bacterium]
MGATEDKDTLFFFRNKPACLAKDFYISRYLKLPSTTPQEANELFHMVHRMTYPLFYSFAEKMDNQEYKKIVKCLKMDYKTLLTQDSECIAIGINPSIVAALDKRRIKELSFQLSDYKNITQILDIMSSKDVFQSLMQAKESTFFSIFNGCGSAYRETFLNQHISVEKLEQLASSRKFKYTVKIAYGSTKLHSLKKNLLHVRAEKVLDHEALFFMGINAINENRKDIALSFFDEASKKAKKRIDADRALFWQYLITKNEKYLNLMVESFDINIYTLYAYEKLGKKPINIITPHFKGEHPTFNIKNPFSWAVLLEKTTQMTTAEIEEEANKYRYDNTLPHYTYLMERALKGKANFYPMPYLQHLISYDVSRVALMLAIARQESRFIPSVVSVSYALGMMQFMPFVAKDIALKNEIEDFDLDNMFDPKTAYDFGNIHLDYLQKYLYHPIFVAYAYNGGIGFTKKLLQSKKHFMDGEYEPFLSLETMPNEESKDYGKKVLANYVVYMQLLDQNVSISNLFETLTQPSYTDRFREKEIR